MRWFDRRSAEVTGHPRIPHTLASAADAERVLRDVGCDPAWSRERGRRWAAVRDWMAVRRGFRLILAGTAVVRIRVCPRTGRGWSTHW